jgi:hypothetical protein
LCGRVHTSLVSEVEIIYVYSVGGLLVVSVHLVVDRYAIPAWSRKRTVDFVQDVSLPLRVMDSYA